MKVDEIVGGQRRPVVHLVELCRELRSKLPELNCLMLTSYTDEEAMMDAILTND